MSTIVLSQHTLEFRGGRLFTEGTDERESQEIIIGPDPVVVGRDPACHLIVDEPGVSAVHAELVATDSGVRIRDLRSTNGIWLGDLRITEAFLTATTAFSIGRSELRFEPAKTEKVALTDVSQFGSLYGTSSAMRDLFRRLEKSAPTDLTILIQGETGTGKELVARIRSRPYAAARAGGDIVAS
jgi:hypothetical protein